MVADAGISASWTASTAFRRGVRSASSVLDVNPKPVRGAGIRVNSGPPCATDCFCHIDREEVTLSFALTFSVVVVSVFGGSTFPNLRAVGVVGVCRAVPICDVVLAVKPSIFVLGNVCTGLTSCFVDGIPFGLKFSFGVISDAAGACVDFGFTSGLSANVRADAGSPASTRLVLVTALEDGIVDGTSPDVREVLSLDCALRTVPFVPRVTPGSCSWYFLTCHQLVHICQGRKYCRMEGKQQGCVKSTVGGVQGEGPNGSTNL